MSNPVEPNQDKPLEASLAAEASVDALVASLRRLRAAARVQLLFQRGAIIVACLLGAAVLVGFLDYLLRLPMGLRVLLWAGGVGGVLWASYRRLVPAARFAPSLIDVALRIERTPEGRRAGLDGVIASGIDLAGAGEGTGPVERKLARQAAAEAAARFEKVAGRVSVLAPKELYRALAMLIGVGIPIFALALAAPEYSRIGWQRVATPWTGAAWPRRAEVVRATREVAHALGTPLPLRAVVTRSRKAQPDVSAAYRVIVGGQPGPIRRVLLTAQNREAVVEGEGGAPPARGALYERFVETTSITPSHEGGAAALEFWFTVEDDETEPWRVLLVEPPTVVRAGVLVELPDYARDVLTSDETFVRGSRELSTPGSGLAPLGRVLAGSRVTLDLVLNKALRGPGAEGAEVWAARVLPGLENAEGLVVSAEASRWTISFVARESLRVPLSLVDAFGIAGTDELVLRVEVVDDQPSRAAVVEPPGDETVLPRAVVEAVGEGCDDVALAWVRLMHQAARAPRDSAGAPPEAQGDPVEAARSVPGEGSRPQAPLRAGAVMDLAALRLVPGDELWLVAESLDVLAASRAGPPSVSPRRRLRVIGEAEFVEQVRAELSQVREAAKRLAVDQGRLRERLDEGEHEPAQAGNLARAQSTLGQRLTPLGDVLRRLSDRVERNRLGDAAIEGMLSDARGHVDAAGVASDKASQELETLRLEAEESPARAEIVSRAREWQREAEEELAALANLLDRGQDAWAVRRELERLLHEQRQLRAQTEAAGEETRGKSPDELTPAQRDDAERRARAQEDAARRVDATIEALRQRAQQVRAGDPGQAQAMDAAASRAQSEQLAGMQRQAAQQIRQNQTAQAEELQERAERAIERVIEELDRVQARREEVLRRVLAGIVESIERLVHQQEVELARLGEVLAGRSRERLDAGMISLQQNTLGVRDRVESEVRQASRLVGLLGAAGEAQGRSVVVLRTADAAGADEHERTSLAKLNEALEEARRLEEEVSRREEAHRRKELRRRYEEILDMQAGLNAQTEPLLGRDLSRRERGEARTIGERQLALRDVVGELRSSTQDLEDAVLFNFAHDRLDRSMSSAAQALREGGAPRSVGSNQRAALRTLQALVQALSDEAAQRDFREQEAGGGGGAGSGSGAGGGLIPPLAELKLLRALQAEAAELTRESHEQGTLDATLLETTARLQSDLAERARELLRKLREQPGDPARSGPGEEEPRE
jgi:hypothetical protein